MAGVPILANVPSAYKLLAAFSKSYFRCLCIVINQETILASPHNDNTQYLQEKCAGAWEAVISEFLPITRNLTNTGCVKEWSNHR